MVREQVDVCKKALQDTLSNEYSSTNYSLDGYREDAVCLQECDGKWLVYVGYRNQKDDMKEFPNIVEACLEMIRLLTGGDAAQNTISNAFFSKIVARKTA